MRVDSERIRRAAQKLGIADSPVCVHSSLRSFGHVEGGAATAVRGLLDAGCTLLVPTFSSGFAVQPPLSMRPRQNGTDYDVSAMNAAGATRIFDPATLELDRDSMGAIPAAVLAMDRHTRGNHPLNSFAVVGPLAAELVTGQEPLKVYEPLEVLTRLGGYVALMGVGLTSMTMLHLAEQHAGRNLFRRWANGRDGMPMMVETGGCSNGFERFTSILEPIERRARVGKSLWHVFPAPQALDLATEAIGIDPQITQCGDSSCRGCVDALLGGPLLPRW